MYSVIGLKMDGDATSDLIAPSDIVSKLCLVVGKKKKIRYTITILSFCCRYLKMMSLFAGLWFPRMVIWIL